MTKRVRISAPVASRSTSTIAIIPYGERDRPLVAGVRADFRAGAGTTRATPAANQHHRDVTTAIADGALRTGHGPAMVEVRYDVTWRVGRATRRAR